MKSFKDGYLYEILISHGPVSSMRLLGEFKGRAGLYMRQSPEVLQTSER